MTALDNRLQTAASLFLIGGLVVATFDRFTTGMALIGVSACVLFFLLGVRLGRRRSSFGTTR